MFALALAVAGCVDSGDPDRLDCSSTNPSPPDECFPYRDTTVHWSFETLSGDSRMSCLPGAPPVQVWARRALYAGSETYVSAACAAGQTQMRLRSGPGIWQFWMTSSPDPERLPYTSLPVYANGGDPMLVAYTDAGYIEARAYYVGDDGRQYCGPPGGGTVRFFVDGAPDADFTCNLYNILGPFPAGAHTLRADAFDTELGVKATSSEVPFDVLPGAKGAEVAVEMRLL